MSSLLTGVLGELEEPNEEGAVLCRNFCGTVSLAIRYHKFVSTKCFFRSLAFQFPTCLLFVLVAVMSDSESVGGDNERERNTRES